MVTKELKKSAKNEKTARGDDYVFMAHIYWLSIFSEQAMCHEYSFFLECHPLGKTGENPNFLSY